MNLQKNKNILYKNLKKFLRQDIHNNIFILLKFTKIILIVKICSKIKIIKFIEQLIYNLRYILILFLFKNLFSIKFCLNFILKLI